ncbi:hypothetical protein [Rhizobium sp. FY34]|uniref:hypothetical protein n=1 Tax=Rhizobium sp. FY34 TaxID=2562309 RepID=UPI001FF0204D|nr:hypothetical protein [Rhizobium sp. FY34]
MRTKTNAAPALPSDAIILTPTQVRGLKLAKDGDLFLQEQNRWTHENATITYARTDRFKERPQKVKFLTTGTLEELKRHGFVESLEHAGDEAEAPHRITMAGKVWLFKAK